MTRPIWERLRERLDALEALRIRAADPAEGARRRAARARLFQKRPDKSEPAGGRLPILAFRKSGERYGIPVSEVLQVETLRHLSHIPGSPPFIRGAVPWRGSILSLLDPGRLLGLADPGLVDLRAFAVVEAAGRRIAVGAEEVETALSVARADIRPLPATPPGAAPEWFLGVHDENRVLLTMGEILKGNALTAWKTREREKR